MNLHSFQNKFRARRHVAPAEEEDWDKRDLTDMADDDFDEAEGTAHLNRIIYVKKSTHMSKTQVVSSGNHSEISDNFNLTLKLNTLVDDIASERQQQHFNQKSPEFPKDTTERMFSNFRPSRVESTNVDQRSTEVKEYKIKITPPKDQRDHSERKLSTSRNDNPPVKKKSITSEHAPREHSVSERKVTVTPKRQQPDRSEKDLSVYNESNHAHRRHTDVKRIIVCVPQRRVSYSPVKPKETLLTEFDNLMGDLRRTTNRKFQDSMFPANSSIIFNSKVRNQTEDFKFERVRQIYEKYAVRLYHHCDPATLIPGSYTSANLYCALVVLADQPNRIANLLENQELSPEGLYYVRLCKDGVWRYVLVDDFLPIRVHKKKHLLFLHTTNQYEHEYEMWAAIIEKAVAKVYGTYEDLVLTKSEGVKTLLKMLSGLPCSEYNLEQNTGLKPFSIILESSLRQHHIVVLQRAAGDHERLKQLNFNPSYSYQVVGMEGDHLTLRNYSEEQPDRRYSLEELAVFGRLLIFKQEENFLYISRTLRHRIGYYSELRFELTRDSSCYLEVWQLNAAYFRGHSPSTEIEYRQGDWLMELRNTSAGSIDETTYIRESGQKLFLHAGSYSLRVHVCLQREYDFTVSYYGEQEVVPERVRVTERWQQSCSCVKK